MMRRIAAAWVALCFAFLPLESTAVLKGVAAAPGLQNAASVAITGGTITGTNAEYTVAQSAIPVIILPTTTYNNNGAAVLGTALPTTYANAYVVVPANSISASVPAATAIYFAQFSSTTAVTIFNNLLSANVDSAGNPTIPASPTAFVTTGAGSVAGVTADTTVIAISLAAGAMGANGTLELISRWTMTNNANGKTAEVKAGSTLITPDLLHASTMGSDADHLLQNRGVQTAQLGMANGSTVYGTGASGSTRIYTSVDFSAAQTLNFIMGHATATDAIVLEGYQVKVMYRQ